MPELQGNSELFCKKDKNMKDETKFCKSILGRTRCIRSAFGVSDVRIAGSGLRLIMINFRFDTRFLLCYIVFRDIALRGNFIVALSGLFVSEVKRTSDVFCYIYYIVQILFPSDALRIRSSVSKVFTDATRPF